MGEMTRHKPSGVGVTDVPVRDFGTRRAVWGLAALLGAMFLGNVDVAIANVALAATAMGLMSVRRG